MDAVGQDLERAGLLSLPVTIVVLIVAFGALVAAGIPASCSHSRRVLAAMGLLALPSQVWPVDDNVGAVVLLVGLAVGVDYCLFYLRRQREERAAGGTTTPALRTAAATSGRAVLVSGVTVVVALAGMFLTGITTFGDGHGGDPGGRGLRARSVTVLPALLSRLGDAWPRAACRSSGGAAEGDRGQRLETA